MSRRVGTLDNPALYGCRSLSVYETRNSALFFKLGGKREAVHGNHRWTTLNGQRMKGTTTFTEALYANRWSEASSESDNSMSRDDWEREEQCQIDLAIAISLEGEGGGAQDREDVSAAVPVEQDASAGASAPAISGDAAARRCAVCLDTEPVMMCRPCNHVVACERCTMSRRLHTRPCMLCRRPIRGQLERVFF